ncbi:MAG: hypothetical protein WCO54_11215 [Bacteroidota bacterium]
MNTKRNKYFLLFFMVVAFFPIIQEIFQPFKLVGLSGAFENHQAPDFSTQNFLDGKYQTGADEYLKENTAFRADMIRLRNQANYSFFGNINTILTLGKEHYIFDPSYISALNGNDFLTDSIRDIETNCLIKSLHILDSLHIPLIFCIAPNKASFYNEFLPQKTVEGNKTNQKYFEKLLTENHVNVINFDSWFKSIKQQSKYLLMPKYGAHWTIYGASLAGDSLFKMVEKVKQKKYASFSVSSYDESSKAKYTDDDYLPALNLIVRWNSPMMAYPQLKFNTGEKPNILAVSDSYFWSFYELEIMQNCASPKSAMWYYNKSVFDYMREKKSERNNAISYQDLKNRDAIIILAAAPSLKNFGYNFFDQLSSISSK